MSLAPVILRDPGDEVDASARLVYRTYIDALEQPSRTTPERAILRAARRCGVSRRRVLEVIRSINQEV